MFGSIGGIEILVLLGIGLIVFGPKRLPEMGRMVARGMGELRKAAAEVKSAVEREADLGDVTQAASELRQVVNTEARKLFTEIEEEANRPGDSSRAGADPPPGVKARKDAGTTEPEAAASPEPAPEAEEQDHR